MEPIPVESTSNKESEQLTSQEQSQKLLKLLADYEVSDGMSDDPSESTPSTSPLNETKAQKGNSNQFDGQIFISSQVDTSKKPIETTTQEHEIYKQIAGRIKDQAIPDSSDKVVRKRKRSNKDVKKPKGDSKPTKKVDVPLTERLPLSTETQALEKFQLETTCSSEDADSLPFPVSPYNELDRTNVEILEELKRCREQFIKERRLRQDYKNAKLIAYKERTIEIKQLREQRHKLMLSLIMP